MMIYADFNATTPLRPEARMAMEPFGSSNFVNPSQAHGELPHRARAALEQAAKNVASLVDCEADEVVFVSGGTESCFQAILGAVLKAPSPGTVLCSRVEHPAVRELQILLTAQPFNWQFTEALPAELDKTFSEMRASILSCMIANNETGICHDVASLFARARDAGAVVHSDATQAVGKIPLSFSELGLDLMSFSGHKLGAPKGIGALIVRRGCAWHPPMSGGGQQDGRRGGTLPVASIVAMGEAARMAALQLSDDTPQRVLELRNAFESRIVESLAGTVIVGQELRRLPNTSCMILPDVLGQAVVEDLAAQDIYISSGSACRASEAKPSPVLRAMGYSTAQALSAVRVSFGWTSSRAELDTLCTTFIDSVKKRAKILRESVIARTNKGKAHERHV